MKSNSKLWAFIRQNQVLVKLLGAILLMGLAFKLFCYGSQVETPAFVGKAMESTTVSSVALAEPEDSDAKLQCDLFTGDWIPNHPLKPIYNYTSQSCPFIEEHHQNCLKNGRPDSRYYYWRWNPRACDLPQFDPHKFLDLMRSKTWAFIGDSMSRNHVISLLCMLSTVEQAVEVYHDEAKLSKRWHFPSYNITLSYIWSAYLVESIISYDENGLPLCGDKVHIDKLDEKWRNLWQNSDYVVISTGLWFTRCTIYYEKNKLVGCHNCSTRNLTEFGIDFGYRKALGLVMNFIATSNHKGMIFYRLSTPNLFQNGGEWHNGGSCTPRTTSLKGVNKTLLDIQYQEFEKAALKAYENGVKLKLLDFTNVLVLRRTDGHYPRRRRYHRLFKFEKVGSDCSHWCLPGPIDAINDVIFEMVVNG